VLPIDGRFPFSFFILMYLPLNFLSCMHLRFLGLPIPPSSDFCRCMVRLAKLIRILQKSILADSSIFTSLVKGYATVPVPYGSAKKKSKRVTIVFSIIMFLLDLGYSYDGELFTPRGPQDTRHK
jgi:hypothetical protein